MGYRTKIIRLGMIFFIIISLNIFAPMHTQGNIAEKPEPFYTMYVNDIDIGTVKYAARGLVIYDKVIAELNKEHDNKARIEASVYFREVDSIGKKLTLEEDLTASIRQSVDIYVDAYALIIDDKPVCCLRTKKEAEDVIEIIKKPYIDNIEKKNNHKLDNVSMQEDITIEKQQVLINRIVDVDYAVKLITVGEVEPREYIVKEGDTLWSISRSFGISIEDIEEANPGIDIDKLQIGQKLQIMKVECLLTVVTNERYVYEEVIPFDSKTVDDKNMYIGDSKITTRGKDGIKEVEVYITKENGREIKREVISEKVIKKPITQIISRGTKKRPVAPATSSRSSRGTFTRPGDTTPISKNGVEATHWDTAKKIFSRGSIAKVTHFDTGLTFYVYRTGGTLHADVEPLTAADTAVMRKIYKSWSWRRESIIVEVNGKKMAASMNGMPHANQTIYDNNFGGHFCIHFSGSLTHGSYRLDPDHQACIKRVVR